MAGQWQDPRWQDPNAQMHVQNSGPQGNYQGQWQPQYPPPPQSPYPPQPRRKSRKGIFGIGCLGLFGLVVLVAALASHPSSSLPAALPTLPTIAVSQQAAPATTAAAAAARTVATFTGSGTQSTAPFTVTANWAVAYSFDCSDFGYKGNFIIMEDGSFTGAMDVNVLALKKSGSSYAYGDAGTHYLKMTTECSWTVKVVDEG